MTGSRLAQPKALEDLLLLRLARLVGVAGSMVTRLCEGRFGITRREWRVLAALVRDGALLSSELAGRAKLDRARTSRAITSMVGKGLVVREAGVADRRQARIVITPEGRAVYDALYPMVRAINAELLGALDAQGVDALDEALDRLQARADGMVAESGTELPKADRRRGARARTEAG